MSRTVRVNFSLDDNHSLDNFPIDLYSGLTSGDTTNLIYSNIGSTNVPLDLEFEDSVLNVNDGSDDPHHPYCYIRISSDGCYDEVILLEVPRVDCDMCAIFVEVIPPTPTPIPTSTPVPDPTATSVVPTSTPVPDPTATPVAPTSTPVPDPTATTEPGPTQQPTPTPTEIPVPTATPVPDPTATPIPTSTPAPTATTSTFPISISLEGNYGVPTSSSIRYTAAFNTTNSGTRTLSAGPDPSCVSGCLSSGTITNAQLGDTAFIVISKTQPDQIATDQVTLSLNVTGSGNVVGVNPIFISVGNNVINQGWTVTGIDETTELSVVIFEG